MYGKLCHILFYTMESGQDFVQFLVITYCGCFILGARSVRAGRLRHIVKAGSQFRLPRHDLSQFAWG